MSKYIDVHVVREITQGLIGRDKIIIYRTYTCIIMYSTYIYTLHWIADLELIRIKRSIIYGWLAKSVSGVGVVIKILNGVEFHHNFIFTFCYYLLYLKRTKKHNALVLCTTLCNS